MGSREQDFRWDWEKLRELQEPTLHHIRRHRNPTQFFFNPKSVIEPDLKCSQHSRLAKVPTPTPPPGKKHSPKPGRCQPFQRAWTSVAQPLRRWPGVRTGFLRGLRVQGSVCLVSRAQGLKPWVCLLEDKMILLLSFVGATSQ